MKPRLVQLSSFLRGTITISLLLAAGVYAWARILFYEVPFSLSEDASIFFKMFILSWGILSGLKASLILLELTVALIQKKMKLSPVARKLGSAFIVLAILSILMYSCQAQVSVGVKKDFNTGMIASYRNMEPSEVLLVMNDEVLTHNDIPIGEKFLLINKDIKGLTVKGGKVSVGCALTITDKNGKKLLEETDLFRGKDVFDKNDATNLKCTVSTGDPMEWEEYYDVVATFWDKYGDGRIENNVKIRMIDIP